MSRVNFFDFSVNRKTKKPFQNDRESGFSVRYRPDATLLLLRKISRTRLLEFLR